MTVAKAGQSTVPDRDRRALLSREMICLIWVLGAVWFVEQSLWLHGHWPLVVAEGPAALAAQYAWLGAAAAVALVVLARVRLRPARFGWPDFLVPALALPVIVWWVLDRGMVHIGGYDYSLIVNYGWLQLAGLRPHVDFPSTLPPHFYLAVKYAFAWFGVAWRSVVLLAAVYAAVSFAWTYLLLRAMELPRLSAALVALLTQAVCLMMSDYFWYNSVSSTDVILLFLSALAWVDRPRSRCLLASVTLTLALVLLDKPNGWVLPVCLAVGFAGSAAHRWRFAGCCVGALALVAAVAYVGPFDPAATLAAYLRLSKSRNPLQAAGYGEQFFVSWEGPVEAVKLCVFAATLPMAAGAALWIHRAEWRTAGGPGWARLWTYAGALATGAAFYLTNNEHKCTDLALPTVAFAVWLAKTEPWTAGSRDARPWQVVAVFGTWLCLFALCQGLFNGWVRHRTFSLNPMHLAIPVLAFAVWAVHRGPAEAVGARMARLVTVAAAAGVVLILDTNYRPTWTDLAVVAVAAAATADKVLRWRLIWFDGDPRRAAAAFGVWLCLFSLAQGLLNGWTRYRVYTIGVDYYWQRQVSDERPATAFMADVRASPRFVQVMRDLERAVRAHPDGQIFFGPDIEFAYAAFGVRPPAGFPVWWHSGISYFPEDAASAVEAFRARRFDTLIFLSGGGFYEMPPEVERNVGKWYTQEQGLETVTVFRHSTAGGGGGSGEQ
jgi:hypothetical protein